VDARTSHLVTLAYVRIFKIATAAQWTAAQATGVFEGAPVDRADGYIHFSTEAQLAETLAKHFAGQRDLVILAVESEALGAALRWEPSRGGQLFPHLYGTLPVIAVVEVVAVDVG